MTGFSNKHVIRGDVPASTADDADLASFIVPAGREVSLYKFSYVSLGRPSSGAAVKLEVVSSANNNLIDLNASAVEGTIVDSADTLPHRIVNSTGADAYFKIRTDGAFTSAGKGKFELHLDYPDVN